jgi:hypothetical protein
MLCLIRGSYFQVGDEVKMEMTVADAYRRSVQTLSDWLHKEINTSKTHVIYRTYAPVHFRSVSLPTYNVYFPHLFPCYKVVKVYEILYVLYVLS